MDNRTEPVLSFALGFTIGALASSALLSALVATTLPAALFSLALLWIIGASLTYFAA